MGKNVVLGVCGGIACYKACDIVSGLKKLGINVDVIMTKNATEFVSPLTFETLSGNPVTKDTFDRERPWEVEHISLAKKADVFVIVPATANVIGKIASGIADDMLTTTVMATKAPVLIAPAMNTNMYENPIVKRNIETLEAYGYNFIDTEIGRLACGDTGSGKLASVDRILFEIERLLYDKKDLVGKRVLVTAGGTEEPIDGVRCITNRSSGKMGLAIAREARLRGADVVVIRGRVGVDFSSYIASVVPVKTTADMYEAVAANMDGADYIVKAAAPADYKVKNAGKEKIKGDRLELSLEKNPDIAKMVGENKGGRKLVIFCAETSSLIENAGKKLIKKNADMVVANDVTKEGAGFDVDTNIVTIIKGGDTRKDYPIMTKRETAKVIVDEMISLK